MSKGEIGIREVVNLVIFVALLLILILIILAISGQLENIAEKLNVPTFGDLVK